MNSEQPSENDVQHDRLRLASESAPTETRINRPWKLLVVDDE